MTIKIKEIKKKNEPFKLDNGGTIFSCFAIIEKDGKEENAKISTYTDKIKLEIGQEYTSGSNCDRIKTYTKSGTRQDGTAFEYVDYTIYAMKNNFSGYKGKVVKNTWSDFEKMAFACHELAVKIVGPQKDTLALNVFDTLIRCASAGVDPTSIKDKPADDIPV